MGLESTMGLGNLETLDYIIDNHVNVEGSIGGNFEEYVDESDIIIV